MRTQRVPCALALLTLTLSSLSFALTATTTTITSGLNPSIYGQPVTFTATVTSSGGPPPNGEQVSFVQGQNVLGTGTLSGGSAEFTISTLGGGGTDNIKAEYAGDATFGSSKSSPVAQVVQVASSTTTLTSSENPANLTQTVVFTATLTPQIPGTVVTGNIQFFSGSTKIGTSALSNNVATFSTSDLSAGNSQITATYKGNSNIQASSGGLDQAIGSGTTIDTSMTWDGVVRYYEVFVPTVLPANPPMLLMLHGTQTTSSESDYESVISLMWGWQNLANQDEFILVKPASTYNANTGQWNWNAYFMNNDFTVADVGTCQSPPATGCPDDSGFLGSLIENLTSQYNVNADMVYVVGFSSGAQMAERVGIDISDLVAAIVPTSGELDNVQGDVQGPLMTPTSPNSPFPPISVQEWQGTEDHELPPCNYGTTVYSKITYTVDTVDATFNYWVSENSCSTLQTTAPLCLNSAPNNNNDAPTPGMSGFTGNIATGCSNGVEVQFIWEPNTAHTYTQQYNSDRWQFLVANPMTEERRLAARNKISAAN
jgi:poly(3-hydroxybutyrate) depolymerase